MFYPILNFFKYHIWLIPLLFAFLVGCLQKSEDKSNTLINNDKSQYDTAMVHQFSAIFGIDFKPGLDITLRDSLKKEVLLGLDKCLNQLGTSKRDSLTAAYLHVSAHAQLRTMGAYQEILDLEPKSREYWEGRIPDTTYAHRLYSVATAHSYFGRYDEAINCNLQSIELARRGKSITHEAMAYLSLGVSYGQLGRVDQVLFYYNKAKKIYQSLGHKNLLRVYNNMSIVHAYHTSLDSGLFYIDSCIALCPKAFPGDTQVYMGALQTKGEVLYAGRAFRRAVNHFHYLLQPENKKHLKYNYILESKLLMGFAYQELNMLDSAAIQLNEVMGIAREQNYRTMVNRAGNALADMYAQRKDFENAYKALYKNRFLQDTLMDEQRIKENEELVARFSLKEKDLALTNARLIKAQDELRITKSRQLNLLLGGMLLMGAVGLTLVIRQANKLNKQKQLLEKQTTIIAQQNTDLQGLNESKDKIFRLIAHDLRGPLGTLTLYPPMVEDMINQQEIDAAKHSLGLMRESITGVHTLLETLLQWSISQTSNSQLDLKPISCYSLFSKVQGLATAQLHQKNIDLHIIHHNDDVMALGDENALFTVLRNLVFNAIKFTNEGGNITLEASLKRGLVSISIKDTGRGMAPPQVTALLQNKAMGSTTGTAGEAGTGLGLGLVKDLIAAQQGELLVESQLGVGSTFTVLLPAAG